MNGHDVKQTLELVRPTVRLHTSWLEAHDEWGPGFHEDGFGLLPTDEAESTLGFAAYVRRLSHESAQASGANTMSCVYRWVVENDRVLGGIALRYGPDDVVHRLGNVGYGIRPSARRRGVATWALGRMIDQAQAVGLDRLLLVCEKDNAASAKTIEANGGLLDEEAGSDGDGLRRYWIEIASSQTKIT